MTVGQRLKFIRDNINQNQGDFADMLGTTQANLSNYENDKRNIPDNLKIKLQQIGININWLLTGEGEPFLADTKKAEQRKDPQLWLEFEKAVSKITAPRLEKLEKRADASDEKFSEVERRLLELEKKAGEKATRYPEETREPAPPYTAYTEPEPTVDLPLAVTLAAGLPVEAFDTGDTYPVPKRLLQKNARYYVARIAGNSMTELGILDGSLVLLRSTNQAETGAISLVRYGSNTTLKRLNQKSDGSWELQYCDGSGAIIPLVEGDWEVKGVFVAVVGKNAKI